MKHFSKSLGSQLIDKSNAVDSLFLCLMLKDDNLEHVTQYCVDVIKQQHTLLSLTSNPVGVIFVLCLTRSGVRQPS